MNIRHELNKAENTNYQMTVPGMLSKGVISAGGIYGAFKLSSKIPTNIPVANLRFLAQQSLPYIDKSTGVFNTGRPWYEAFGKTAQSKSTVQDLILNAIKATEEQLFKIPRAFSGFSILSGHSLKNIGGESGFLLNPSMIANQKRYLEIISKGKINDKSIAEGIRFVNGQIRNTVTDEVLLNNASMHYNYWNSSRDAGLIKGAPKKGFASRWGQALYRRYGLQPTNSDFIITGGQNIFESVYRKFNAGIMVGVENYMKLLDDPFEALIKPAENFFGPRVKGAFKQGSKFWNTLGMRNILGVGGWDQIRKGGGIGKMLGRHAIRGLPILAAGIWGASTLDELSHGRIKGTGARIYQDVSVLGSRLSDVTGMTALAKKQKEVAPGSTSIPGLAALPTSLAILGSTVGGLQNLVEKTPIGEKVLPPSFYTKGIQSLENVPLVGRAIKSLNLGNKGRVGAYAAMGAALGTVLVLPFVPGALGSEKSAEEKKEIYSGNQKVPVRYGRRWEFGITPYEGEDIKFYEPHWTVKAITDAAKRSKLGKFYGNPLARILNKIVDPYYLERSLDKERPYAYWGPSDAGLGFTEKLLTPIKEIFKPTIVAHSEALGVDHPSRNKRVDKTPPESLSGNLAISTGNVSTPPEKPSSAKSYIKETVGSFKDTLGLIGFTYGSVFNKATGGQGLLAQDAVYETSGRIMSAQRAYWDAELGGMAGLNEFYRRLNPNRSYGTEYVQAAIRNTQPSWMPEKYQYGDPYSSVQQGEYRMPGTGYEALHPELKGVEPEKYPAIHRLNILHDVDRQSIEYYRTLNEVENQLVEGNLSDGEKSMYENIMQREQQMRDEELGRFDFGDKGAASSYWLALKQFGRSIPTEHLYPISPVHKFAGPVDPMSEYKSMMLLDSPFKQWSNPISDYIVPTFNRTMDNLTFGNYIPGKAKKKWEIEDAFQKVQFTKNQLLDQQSQEYFDKGDLEAASYIKSGKRNSIYDVSAFADIDEQSALINQKERKYFQAFANMNEGRSQALRSMSPATGEMLKGQWMKHDLSIAGEFEKLSEIQRTAKPIGEGMSADDLIASGEVPDRDFTGYAPGVNLNAFKVKVVSNTGQNIRDFNLWKEDERQARLLDALSRSANPDKPMDVFNINSRNRQKKELQNTLSSIGMRNVELNSIPITGKSRIHFQGQPNNNDSLHAIMREEGYVTY